MKHSLAVAFATISTYANTLSVNAEGSTDASQLSFTYAALQVWAQKGCNGAADDQYAITTDYFKLDGCHNFYQGPVESARLLPVFGAVHVTLFNNTNCDGTPFDLDGPREAECVSSDSQHTQNWLSFMTTKKAT